MFSLWVGDCAHNLRSVLDHIAWELVSCSGQTPSTATQFPLKAIRPQQLSITPDPGIAAMEIVDQFQPYQSGGPHAVLALLHLLDIIDKHRELLANVTAVDVPYFGTPEGVQVKDAYAYGGALTQGARLMHALVDPPQPNGGLTGHATLAVKVAASINWTPILDAPPIDIFLRDAVNHVAWMLSEFDRFFMDHDPPTAA